MKRSSVVYVVAVFFVGCLVMVGQCKHIFTIILLISLQGQCRADPKSTYETDHGNAAMVVSSLDESKLTIKWCVARDCKTKGEPNAHHCFCCLNAQGAPCFSSRGDCQDHCPTLPPGK
ncbi:hypothetical protein ACQJBY_004175 [Aegilops geniculata]